MTGELGQAFLSAATRTVSATAHTATLAAAATSWWQVLGVGVASGLVASLLWILIFRRIRPRVEISPHIAHSTVDGPPSYRVKILNKSRFDLLDVRIESMIVEARNVPGGTIFRRNLQPVKPPEILVLERKPWLARWEKDRINDAFRIKLDWDLKALWSDPVHTDLRVRLVGRHAFSGVGRAFEHIYHDPDTCIKHGSFKKGRTMEIEERTGSSHPTATAGPYVGAEGDED